MQIGMSQNQPSAPGGARATGQASGRHWGRILACCVVMAAFAGVIGPGQNTAGMPRGISIPDHQPNQMPSVIQQMQMQEQQAKQKNYEAANAERKRQIAEDSANLLKLAVELKTEVDKTNKDVLSITVIRKADAIEKLARQVKEKMKLTVGAG
jgi:hypothetical protein